MRKAQIFVCLPFPLGAPRGGGQNLKCKFKTFGSLDTLKVNNTHTVQLPSIYYTLSLLQIKLAEKTAN